MKLNNPLPAWKAPRLKKLGKFAILICLVQSFKSCNIYHPERNRINFVDSFSRVQNALVKITPLLEKLTTDTFYNTRYSIENGLISINGSSITNIEKIVSPFLSQEDKRKLIDLIHYLSQNYISSSYYDKSSQRWTFIYRPTAENTFNDVRNIVVFRVAPDSADLIHDTILDRKEKVYLLGPKDARIF